MAIQLIKPVKQHKYRNIFSWPHRTINNTFITKLHCHKFWLVYRYIFVISNQMYMYNIFYYNMYGMIASFSMHLQWMGTLISYKILL